MTLRRDIDTLARRTTWAERWAAEHAVSLFTRGGFFIGCFGGRSVCCRPSTPTPHGGRCGITTSGPNPNRWATACSASPTCRPRPTNSTPPAARWTPTDDPAPLHPLPPASGRRA